MFTQATGSDLFMETPFAERPTLAQRLLGLFVVAQLLFLVCSNVLAFFPLSVTEEGELTDARSGPHSEAPSTQLLLLEKANAGLQAWAHATGQVQTWWLFAPSFPARSTFPVVTLHWNADPAFTVRLPSIQEPLDPTSYFRPPGSHDRFFHYEVRLGLLATGMDQENLEQEADAWSEAIRQRVRRQWKSMRAFMRWRAAAFGAEHPERPAADEIVLSMRIYKTPEPGAQATARTPPIEQPLARWVPALEGRSDCLPVEAFDPVRQQFRRLNAEE
jgi:hypothetical protein